MRAWISFNPWADYQPVHELEDYVRQLWDSTIDARISWYWDDNDPEEPTEYGVWIDTEALCEEHFAVRVVEIAQNCIQRFGELEVELPT